MAKHPSSVVFRCQSCDFIAKADARKGTHLLPWMRKLRIQPDGRCKACGGDCWTISLLYIETGRDGGMGNFAVSAALGAAFGPAGVAVAGEQVSTSTNQSDYPNVPAAVIAKINAHPPSRMQRVAEYAIAAQRAMLKEQGGRECSQCGALFVPSEGKRWFELGYCSKLCAVKAEGAEAVVATSDPTGDDAPQPNAIRVKCIEGHEFDVGVSFRGMVRPCPHCGAKTKVE